MVADMVTWKDMEWRRCIDGGEADGVMSCRCGPSDDADEEGA